MKNIFIIFVMLFLSCCNDSNIDNLSSTETEPSVWCVPENKIGGGTSFFPLLEMPTYKTIHFIESLNYLKTNSKVALLKYNGDIYIYPYDFTNYYEVINNNFNNKNLIFSYCPLTQSALCFEKNIEATTDNLMKASGYLYNDNLVLANSSLEEYWSQMDSKVIRGTNKSERIQTYNVIETIWDVAKTYYSNAKVFYHDNTNFCDGCITNEVPLNYNNLFGVINEHVLKDTVHLFNYNTLGNSTKIETITVNGKKTLIIGNKSKVFFNAFYIPSTLSFEVLSESEFPLVLVDNENNKWDIFGFAIEGPRAGQQLSHPKSFVAGEWAWIDFYTNRILHF